MNRVFPLALVLSGCNAYDLFVIDRVDQDAWPSQLDILLVMDRSESMSEESAALGGAFIRWTNDLQDQQRALSYDGLTDAVGAAVDRAQDSAPFTDIQFGVLTADASTTLGALQGPTGVISRAAPDFAENLQQSLLCGATCLQDLPDDPSFTCGDAVKGELSAQAMDCLCGDDLWRFNCGGDIEEPFESVLLAMCRSVDDPPEACFDEFSLFQADHRGTNAGLIRKDSLVIPIVFTDEGDASRRAGGERAVPEIYQVALQDFGVPMVWAVVGPEINAQNLAKCPGKTTGWGTLRYKWMVERTGGLSLPIHDENCDGVDFDETLDRLSDLISGHRGALKLSRRPDPETLLITVGGKVVPRAQDEIVDGYNFPRRGPGWTYRADPPTVFLSGEYAPASGERMEARYLPLGASDRSQ